MRRWVGFAAGALLATALAASGGVLHAAGGSSRPPGKTVTKATPDKPAAPEPQEQDYIEIHVGGTVQRVPLPGEASPPIPLGPELELLVRRPLPETPEAAGSTPPAEPAGSPSNASSVAPASSPGALSSSIKGLGVGAAAGAGVIGVGALFFFVVQPYRRRRPLRQAMVMLADEASENLDAAENLLDQALTAGLRRRDIAAARFALAYVRARQGRYGDALAVLTDLQKSGSVDREAAYLTLWVYTRLNEHDRVANLYAQHAKLLNGLLDTELMAGMAYLNLAKQHWSRKQPDVAMQYFGLLRTLNVLVDEIPTGIEDHRVVLGVEALFGDDFAAARSHFTAAVEEGRQKGAQSIEGTLGLLLCEWREKGHCNIDDDLKALVRTLLARRGRETGVSVVYCAHCKQPYRVAGVALGKRVTCRACRRRFVAEARAASEETSTVASDPATLDYLLSPDDLLLRNVLLWYAVSLLSGWRNLPERSGLPQQGLERLQARAQRVLSIDPAVADPLLIEGLIRYYFAPADEERKTGLDLLEKAVTREVSVPEVLSLVDREKRQAQRLRNVLTEYLAVVGHYLADAGVPETHRNELRRRLRRFSRFRPLDREVALPTQESELAPSVASLHERAELLRRRMGMFVKPRLTAASPQDKEQLEAMQEALASQAGALRRTADEMEVTERDLVALTGEFLLADEPDMDPVDASPGSPAQPA